LSVYSSYVLLIGSLSMIAASNWRESPIYLSEQDKKWRSPHWCSIIGTWYGIHHHGSQFIFQQELDEARKPDVHCWRTDDNWPEPNCRLFLPTSENEGIIVLVCWRIPCFYWVANLGYCSRSLWRPQPLRKHVPHVLGNLQEHANSILDSQ
jgi:hypothetical protein